MLTVYNNKNYCILFKDVYKNVTDNQEKITD